ncbi:hypothetical protein [Christiangramia aquimixticola]|uniref:hypothetical protein n=1 Tax=Christiangramia aquimixticola TaxID=1697558 RepID=UPI003AA7D224
MKTLFFSLLLIAVTAIGHTQEIELEEAKVGFTPMEAKITRDGDNFTFNIKESYTGEFEKDALGFMQANFDILGFIQETQNEDYDSYLVTFRSGKGYLTADFDKEGNLVKTSQKFENIILPLDVRREVYQANQGWTMTANKYAASGRANLLEKEVYKIKLVNNNQKRTVKLDPKNLGRTSVASN